MQMIPPDRVPRERLKAMASISIGNAWHDLRAVLGPELAEMNNLIFASLLTALVNEAQLRGVEMDQIKGELEGWTETKGAQ